MSDQRIIIRPVQLRQMAETLEEKASRIEQSVEGTSERIFALANQDFFAGYRADQLFNRFRAVEPTARAWPQQLRQFAQLLDAAADAFEEADNSVELRDHYDNEDAWRRMVESDEAFLDHLEDELTGLNYWKNKLAGTLDDYEALYAATQERLFASRERLAMDMIDNIEGLDPAVWATLSTDERMAVMDEVHRAYAEAYGFEPVPTSYNTEFQSGLHGMCSAMVTHNHAGDMIAIDYSTMQIQLNDDLLYLNDPSEALGTMIHESRHALQYNSVVDGGMDGDFDYVPESYMEDWRSSFNTNSNYAYWTKPTEVDARDASDRASDHLYE